MNDVSGDQIPRLATWSTRRRGGRGPAHAVAGARAPVLFARGLPEAGSTSHSTTSSPPITAASTSSPRKSWMMIVASSSQGMGAQNRFTNCLSGWVFSSTTALGPNCFNRTCASAVVSPRWLPLADPRGAASLILPLVTGGPMFGKEFPNRGGQLRENVLLADKAVRARRVSRRADFRSVIRGDHDHRGCR